MFTLSVTTIAEHHKKYKRCAGEGKTHLISNMPNFSPILLIQFV